MQDGLGQVRRVAVHRRENAPHDHIPQGSRLDGRDLAVILQVNLVPGPHLRLAEDVVAGEQADVLGIDIGGHAVHGVPQVAEAPALGLPDPVLAVAVAVEDDTLVGLEGVMQQVLQVRPEVVGLLQNVRELLQLLGHDGVEHHVGAGDGLGGAQHTELELVAGEGQGRGAVAVRGVLGNLRQGVHADLQLPLGLVHIGLAVDDGIQDGRQLIAQEHGDDGRRGLVAAQPVVVAGVGHAAAQHILILVHALDKRRQEQQELGVLAGGLAGLEQILAGVRGQGPVVMLAAAVDAGKGLLVQQAHQTVAVGHLLQKLHGQLVVVAGAVGIGIHLGHLVLGGSHLVVLRLGGNAHLPQLLIQLVHEFRHPGLDGPVVVVVQFLALGGFGAEQGPAAEDQVLPAAVHLLVDEEILLLRAYLGGDVLGLSVAEQPQDADALGVQQLHGTQQGGLFVQSLAAVGTENGGDIQGLILHKGVGRGIPGGVAPGLEGGPQAAGGEAGGVRLAPGQLLAGQLHQHAGGPLGGDEAVVLLGGEAGHGLEPVGIVGGPLFNGPFLHGGGNLVGDGAVQ